MPRWTRFALPGVIVAGILALNVLPLVRPKMLLGLNGSISVTPMKYSVRSAAGTPLTTIFENLGDSRLEDSVLVRLVSEAKTPPRDPCRKPSLSKLLDVLIPATVYAQDCGGSCTSHYNREEFEPVSCGEFTICINGSEYDQGCVSHLFQCPDDSWLCGQITCPNP